MKKIVSILLAMATFSAHAMQLVDVKNSPPRSYLIPMHDEFFTSQSLMGCPPNKQEPAKINQIKSLSYIDFNDNELATDTIFQLGKGSAKITVKAGNAFALVLASAHLPAQSNQYLQWVLSKEPRKLAYLASTFGNVTDPEDDSIAFVFKGKAKDSEELSFARETIDGQQETCTIHIDIE